MSEGCGSVSEESEPAVWSDDELEDRGPRAAPAGGQPAAQSRKYLERSEGGGMRG